MPMSADRRESFRTISTYAAWDVWPENVERDLDLARGRVGIGMCGWPVGCRVEVVVSPAVAEVVAGMNLPPCYSVLTDKTLPRGRVIVRPADGDHKDVWLNVM